MTYTQLVGGGWSPEWAATLYRPFLAAAGARPTIACVVLRETEQSAADARALFDRWAPVLTAAAPCDPRAVVVDEGSRFDPAALDGADGLFVCGGLTPAYAAALAPAAAAVRAWLDADRPYLGFSAGSAIAADRAIVGGWRGAGRAVCPQDSAEDLDDVTVVDGLGLVPFAVDVHCAQWGTLPRAVWAVAQGLVAAAVAVDEDTAIVVTGEGVGTIGAGHAHLVRRADPEAGASVTVRQVSAGEKFATPARP